MKVKFQDKEYFKFSFDAEAKIFKPERKKELLASLSHLASQLPSGIDFEKNADLMPVAFDAFVVNRRNKNCQVIGTKKALEIADNFKNKFINLEHDRDRIVGAITNVGFSSFGDEQKELTRADVEDSDEPFNIVLGGVLWRIVDERVMNIIEDASNELSKNYKKVGSSWELLSSDFQVAVFDPEDKDLSQASIDTSGKYLDDLVTNGGNGNTEDGKIVCELIAGETLSLGMGLTTNPAAEVEGVLTAHNIPSQTYEASNSLYSTNSYIAPSEGAGRRIYDASQLIPKEKKENDINIDKNSVKEVKDKIIMIKSIDELTDENLQEVKASAIKDIHNTYVESLKEESQKYAEELATEKKTVATQTEALEAAVNEAREVKEQYEEVKKTLEALQAAEADRIAKENFNSRMEILNNEFEITDAAAKVIASKVREVETDEQFEALKEEFSALLSAKTKEVESKEENTDSQAKEVIASALENGEKDVSTPNGSDAEPTQEEKWIKAASEIVLTNGKNRKDK